MKDPAKAINPILRDLERIKRRAGRTVLGLFADPKLVEEVRPDGTKLKVPTNPNFNIDAMSNWQDCSMKTRAALDLVKQSLADERAKNTAPVTQVFGMVLMQPRLEDHAEWERMAANESEGRIVGDSVSEQVVQRGIGPVSEGAGELRAHLPQENAKAGKEAAKG